MGNFLILLRKQISDFGLNRLTELDRLGVLQRTAAHHRAALTDEMKRAERDGSISSPETLKLLKKSLNDADTAHMAALQKWENRESGQKSY